MLGHDLTNDTLHIDVLFAIPCPFFPEADNLGAQVVILLLVLSNIAVFALALDGLPFRNAAHFGFLPRLAHRPASDDQDVGLILDVTAV